MNELAHREKGSRTTRLGLFATVVVLHAASVYALSRPPLIGTPAAAAQFAEFTLDFSMETVADSVDATSRPAEDGRSETDALASPDPLPDPEPDTTTYRSPERVAKPDDNTSVNTSVTTSVSTSVNTSAKKAAAPLSGSRPQESAQPHAKPAPAESSAMSAATSGQSIRHVSRLDYAGRAPQPVYPSVARRQGLEGRVVLRVTIDRAGQVSDVAVMQSSGSGALDEAAITAIRQTAFKPYRENGMAKPAAADVPFHFLLRKSP